MATFAKSNLDKIARGLETTPSGTTLYDLVVALRAELDDIRTKYAATLTKLNADGGVTDVNYDTNALAAAAFATSAS